MISFNTGDPTGMLANGFQDKLSYDDVGVFTGQYNKGAHVCY